MPQDRKNATRPKQKAAKNLISLKEILYLGFSVCEILRPACLVQFFLPRLQALENPGLETRPFAFKRQGLPSFSMYRFLNACLQAYTGNG